MNAKVEVADEYVAEFEELMRKFGVSVVGYEPGPFSTRPTVVASLDGTPYPGKWLSPVFTKHEDGDITVSWNPL